MNENENYTKTNQYWEKKIEIFHQIKCQMYRLEINMSPPLCLNSHDIPYPTIKLLHVLELLATAVE